MDNTEQKKVKPSKYIMYEGHLYKRVPNKDVKEAIAKYNDLSDMVDVLRGASEVSDDE